MYFRKRGHKYAAILFVMMVISSLTESYVYARRYFLMEFPELNYRFSYEFEKEKRSGPNLERKDETMTFFEGLDIKTGGWVYHPALLEYKLRLLPEWEQMSEKIQPDLKVKTRNFLQGYFFDATILKSKPYTLRLFANRRRLTLSSNFAKRSKNDVDTYGSVLIFKYPVLPTTVNYTRTESRQTGFFDFDEDIDELRLRMRFREILGDSRLRASYKDTSTTIRGQTSGNLEQKVDLLNSHDFEKKRTLRTNLEYRETRGDFFDLTRYLFSEKLSWQHRKNLRTNYNLSYEKSDFETSLSEAKSLGFNLTHVLYENLTSSVNATGAKNQFSGNKELEYGGRLHFNYVRKIPWGSLNINMGHDYMINEQDKIEDLIEVNAEPVTLTIGDVTLLKNKHVDIDSIEVWNESHNFKFREDIDYRVTELGSQARITCVSGELIDNNFNCSTGAPVVVDYMFLSDPPFDFTTFSRTYGIRLNIRSVWNIYYNLYLSNERFLSGIPPEELTDDKIHSAGTELTWRWSKTGLVFSDSDTINIPKKTWDIREMVTFRPSKDVFFSFSGGYRETEFKDTGDVETFNSITANMQMLTSRKSRLIFKGFRNKVSGMAEENINSGFSAIFEMAYRILRGSMEYTFSNEKDEIAREIIRNHSLLLEVKTMRF
jgi:hypothetical protein